MGNLKVKYNGWLYYHLTLGKEYEVAVNMGEEVNYYVLIDDRGVLITCPKDKFIVDE